MKLGEVRMSPQVLVQTVATLAILWIAYEMHGTRQLLDTATMSAIQLPEADLRDARNDRDLAKALVSLVARLESLHASDVRPSDGRATRPNSATERELMGGGTPDALGRLTQAIQSLARRVSARSAFPVEAGTPPPTNARSVGALCANLRKNQSGQAEYLLLGPAEVLARFGKPTHIEVDDKRILKWSYTLGDDCFLAFRFHEGRVISASPW